MTPVRRCPDGHIDRSRITRCSLRFRKLIGLLALLLLVAGGIVGIAAGQGGELPPAVAEIRDHIVTTALYTLLVGVICLILAGALLSPLLSADLDTPSEWREKRPPFRSWFFAFSSGVLALYEGLLGFLAIHFVFYRAGVSLISVLRAFPVAFPLLALALLTGGMAYGASVPRALPKGTRAHGVLLPAVLLLLVISTALQPEWPFTRVAVGVVLCDLALTLTSYAARSRSGPTRETLPSTLLTPPSYPHSSPGHMTTDQDTPFPAALGQRYRAVHLIGEGGIARVYVARRRTDGEEVAIKVPIGADEATGRSFLREIAVWQGLTHPRIVRIFRANILPVPYVEMEYLGRTLAGEALPMDPEKAVPLLIAIGEGLIYAHQHGVAHHDIKPSNILLDQSGDPKISDWGLSHQTGGQPGSSVHGYSPGYAAPEQVVPGLSGDLGARIDIFQFGVLTYELFTGRLPFPDWDAFETPRPPPPPSHTSPRLAPLDSVILRCLEFYSEARYQSMEEVLADLRVAWTPAITGLTPLTSIE
jgi:hypothetical protein